MIETQQPLRFTWISMVLWVGLTTLGYLPAADLHYQTGSPFRPLDLRDVNLSAALVGFIFGGVSGLIISSLQWLILRSWTTKARI